MSPDSEYVYITSEHAKTLVVLDRDKVSGKTTVKQVIEDETGDAHGLAGAFAVTCSPDGKFV